MAVVIDPIGSAPEPFLDGGVAAIAPGAPVGGLGELDSALLAGRYRVLHPSGRALLGYDERLARPVRREAVAPGVTLAEHVRLAAASGIPVLDAVAALDGSFLVRPC